MTCVACGEWWARKYKAREHKAGMGFVSKNKTNKNWKASTLHMWLCMKWHGLWCTCERAEMAAVSGGTSHVSAVSTPLWWLFKNTLEKASRLCRITRECSKFARERRLALHKSDQQQLKSRMGKHTEVGKPRTKLLTIPTPSSHWRLSDLCTVSKSSTTRQIVPHNGKPFGYRGHTHFGKVVPRFLLKINI